jgi:predicted phosphodiesterase
MRLAILSDIHGNSLALDAVLADIQSQGEVDEYWVLGDFSALGYDPVTPLETISALPHAHFTRGNTDRYVVTGDLPVPPEKALQDPALLPEHGDFLICWKYIDRSGNTGTESEIVTYMHKPLSAE